MERRFLVQATVLFAVCAAGVFAGNFGWSHYEQHRAELRAAAAAKAAEDERQSPAGQQREVVKQSMHDPESAQFRNVRQSKGLKTAWCGEINGRNRMGGMVGFRRYVAVLEEDRARQVLDRVDFEPPSTADTNEQAAFKQRWGAFCY